jgi:transglutaminase-like putative cysteine protease
MKRKRFLMIVLSALLMLNITSGCQENGTASIPSRQPEKNHAQHDTTPPSAAANKPGGGSFSPNPDSSFDMPGVFPPEALLLPALSDTMQATQNGEFGIDYGNAAHGYVFGWYTGSKEKAKLKITHTASGQFYNYDLSGKKEPYPLQMGEGGYEITAYEHAYDNKYIPVLSVSADVSLNSAFDPFLYPTKLCQFDQDSLCVQKAFELAQGCESDLEVVAAVFEYLKTTIHYDQEKAAANPPFYTPDPDETLRTQKGICFDYAALVCAMLRANQIPTKLIMGDIAVRNSNETIYHAWNAIYLQNQGWIGVQIQVSNNRWEIIDVTFAVGMDDDTLMEYIGSGENYIELKAY